jgi:hypothetical protein
MRCSDAVLRRRQGKKPEEPRQRVEVRVPPGGETLQGMPPKDFSGSSAPPHQRAAVRSTGWGRGKVELRRGRAGAGGRACDSPTGCTRGSSRAGCRTALGAQCGTRACRITGRTGTSLCEHARLFRRPGLNLKPAQRPSKTSARRASSALLSRVPMCAAGCGAGTVKGPSFSRTGARSQAHTPSPPPPPPPYKTDTSRPNPRTKRTRSQAPSRSTSRPASCCSGVPSATATIARGAAHRPPAEPRRPWAPRAEPPAPSAAAGTTAPRS